MQKLQRSHRAAQLNRSSNTVDIHMSLQVDESTVLLLQPAMQAC
jgi:hypothetical protein